MFNTLDSQKAIELSVVRHNWINPVYELKDDANSYGTMTYSGISKRHPVIKTANDDWTFEFEGLGRRDITVLDKNNKQIGKLTREPFSRINTLTMETGFTAKFHRNSFFSRNSVWEADGYGLVMHINNPFFSCTYPVNIAQNMVPQTLIPLLIFLGVHRVIVDQQKKAMMASH